MNNPRVRAAELVSGDIAQWKQRIAAMPASELFAVGDELAAMVRHPVTYGMTGWRERACERIGAVLHEADQRWHALSGHESNAGIAERMRRIYEYHL